MVQSEVAEYGTGDPACFDNVIIEDNESVRVQAFNSSDFVIGKQTNFNGPVTIISGSPSITSPQHDNERVVIRDSIWTQATASALETEAQEKAAIAANGAHPGGNSRSQDLPYVAANVKPEPVSYKYLLTLASSPYFGIPLIVWILTGVALLSCLIAVAIQFTTESRSEGPYSPGETELKNYIGDKTHILYHKADWGGLNASSKIAIKEPVPYVVISHTAAKFCYRTDDCQEVLVAMQKDHMSRNPAFADIAYNFMVGGDGYIYEGRGWGVRSPHEGFVGNRNIDITFIGDFSVYDVPTPTQVDAVKKLLIYGVENCHIDRNYNEPYNIADDDTYIGGDRAHRFYRKSDWGAQEPSARVRINEPVPYVLISHTVGPNCFESFKCAELLRNMQQDHMSRTPAYADIAFSFVLGGDGNVYEGRGWGVRSSHDGFLEKKSLDIAFTGDFSGSKKPKPAQVDALKKLLEFGVARCHLDPNYSLIAANSVYNTLSPGRNVYDEISKFEHFDPRPTDHLAKHQNSTSPCLPGTLKKT